MPTSLAQRVRTARVRYGMSQAELARRIGVSKNTMNALEAGRTPDPSSSIIKAIADVLGVSADYLLGRQDPDDDEEPRYHRRRAVA